MLANDKARRCKGKNKSGQPCGAAATAGGVCYFHANPDKASELGRKGGRQNRHTAGDSVDPLPILDNPLAVRETVARLIADVYAGKVNPRIASGLAPLLNLQLRAIETTDMERRLADLEKKLAEEAAKNGGK
jgi:general stress protein YciG